MSNKSNIKFVDAIRKVPDPNGNYYYVQRIRERDYPTADWAHNPDISAVDGVEQRYWKWDDDAQVVLEMTQEEKDNIDNRMENQEVELQSQVMWTFQNTGRFYLRNHSWVTDGDDYYGTSYFQFSESGGAYELPIDEWEHQGCLVSAGDIVRRLTLSGRANVTGIDDIEIILLCRTPTDLDSWNDGIQNDAQMQSDIVFRDFFVNPQNEKNGPPFGGNFKKIRRRTFDVNFEVPKDGFLTLYLRPINSGNSQRYFYATYQLQILTQE